MQGVAIVDHTGMKDEEKDTGRIEAFSSSASYGELLGFIVMIARPVRGSVRCRVRPVARSDNPVRDGLI
jgi:hypothetical protein